MCPGAKSSSGCSSNSSQDRCWLGAALAVSLVFILSHDELSPCPSLVQIYAHLFNCCVYLSAPAAFKEKLLGGSNEAHQQQ